MSDRKSSIAVRWRSRPIAGVAAEARRRVLRRRRVKAAEALLAAGRVGEAETLVAGALGEHPGDPDLLILAAKAAFRAGRLRESIGRWEAARAAAPGRWRCHVGLAGTLRLARDTGQAAEVIAAARTRFPNEPTVIGEAARIAEARGDFAGALALWRRLTARWPSQVLWLGAEANALMMLDRLDEADAVLAAADRRLAASAADRDMHYMLGLRGRLLAARKQWSAAVAFWTNFQARYPDSQLGWQHLGHAVENLSFARVEDTAGGAGATGDAAQPASIDVVENAEARALLMGFESIGSGCEFGLVQRRFGAEPLSLLRWNAAPIAAVIAALESDLDGLGAPETTELMALANGEYFVRDARWGLAMHTWLFVGQVEAETLLARMCRRVAFLKDKLLADAASAEKVFVHHSDRIEAETFARLHALLRRHGPVRLLGVQPACGGVRAGEVVQVGEDRFIGFVERFGRRESGEWDIRFDEWLAVCRATAAAIEAARGRAAVAEFDATSPA